MHKKKHAMRSHVKVKHLKHAAPAKRRIQHHPKATFFETVKTKVTHRAHIMGDVMPQHGKTNLRRDEARGALPPGKRMSKDGSIYWETRKNRSDTHNDKDKYHGRV